MPRTRHREEGRKAARGELSHRRSRCWQSLRAGPRQEVRLPPGRDGPCCRPRRTGRCPPRRSARRTPPRSPEGDQAPRDSAGRISVRSRLSAIVAKPATRGHIRHCGLGSTRIHSRYGHRCARGSSSRPCAVCSERRLSLFGFRPLPAGALGRPAGARRRQVTVPMFRGRHLEGTTYRLFGRLGTAVTLG